MVSDVQIGHFPETLCYSAGRYASTVSAQLYSPRSTTKIHYYLHYVSAVFGNMVKKSPGVGCTQKECKLRTNVTVGHFLEICGVNDACDRSDFDVFYNFFHFQLCLHWTKCAKMLKMQSHIRKYAIIC